MKDLRRVRIKHGDAEFEADVPEDQVQGMYDQFLTRLEAAAKSPAGATARINNSPADPLTPDDVRLAKIFELRADDLVVLRVRPPSNIDVADQIALLLFGYRRLKNEENVLATQLLKAANHSGLGLDRIDRAVGSHVPQYILRGGQKKASTYTLTTQGVTRAEELIAQMPI